MARTRAARRALREADRDRRITAARERNALQQRRRARIDRIRERLQIASSPGLVARARRRRTRLLVFVVVLVNALTWLLTSSAAARGMVAVLAMLVFPIFAVLWVGRSR